MADQLAAFAGAAVASRAVGGWLAAREDRATASPA